MSKIYVASSWRNPRQIPVVQALRHAGHEVYDFRNPAPGKAGFAWSDIDPDWLNWDASQFRTALRTPIALAGFALDHAAMEWADTVVLVLPCGRSAHLELGWFCGAGKRTIVLLDERQEPELMYLEAQFHCLSMPEVLCALAVSTAPARPAPAPHTPVDAVDQCPAETRMRGWSHEEYIRHVRHVWAKVADLRGKLADAVKHSPTGYVHRQIFAQVTEQRDAALSRAADLDAKLGVANSACARSEGIISRIESDRVAAIIAKAAAEAELTKTHIRADSACAERDRARAAQHSAEALLRELTSGPMTGQQWSDLMTRIVAHVGGPRG